MIDQYELHDRPIRFNVPEPFTTPLHEALISRRPRLIFAWHHRIAGLNRVACRPAVTEPCPDVPQIAALADWFKAKRTETLPERRPAIDQHEFHVAPPKGRASHVRHAGSLSENLERQEIPRDLSFCPQATRNRHSQRLSLSRRALKCSTHLLEQRAVRQQ